MPRFFFHVHDDFEAKDEEGLELPDAKAARDGAIRSARALMCDALMAGRLVLRHRIDIADAQHTVIDTVHFGDVVQIEG